MFVAMISPTRESFAYILWFDAASASYEDEGFDIAVDDTGQAFVSGYSWSADFCSLFGRVPGYNTS